MESPIGCSSVKSYSIRVASGLYVDLLEPTVEQITLRDICSGLSRECRFGGQFPNPKIFYSVAEHSVMCYWHAKEFGLSDPALRAIFLHDAHEAYLKDIPRPLKMLLGANYRLLVDRFDEVIAAKFGVDFSRWENEIRQIDNELLFAERDTFFPPDGVAWHGENDVRRASYNFYCWNNSAAYDNFLRIAQLLGLHRT